MEVFRMICNDSRSDQLLMATELLNARIVRIKERRVRRTLREKCKVSAEERYCIVKTILLAVCELPTDCCQLIVGYTGGASGSFRPSLRRTTWSMFRWQLRDRDTIFDCFGRTHREVDLADMCLEDTYTRHDSLIGGRTSDLHGLNYLSDSEAESYANDFEGTYENTQREGETSCDWREVVLEGQ